MPVIMNELPPTTINREAPPPSLVGNLTLLHLCLDSANPCTACYLSTREMLVYVLTGRIRVYTNGMFLGTFGGRSSILEPLVHVVRFPAGHERDVTLVLDGWAADCILASCDAPLNPSTSLPYCHWNDTFFHQVGSGTHQRTVAEVPTPRGFHLSCGETVNPPGGTSSWPPHASDEDLCLYEQGATTWEESFYLVCPKPGMIELDGLDRQRKVVHQTVKITNGAIMDMPLGSHKVTAAPDAYCYYFWAYCGDALRKEYRRHSTDVAIYRT